MYTFISRDNVLETVIYGSSEMAGIESLVAAGAISGIAVLFTFTAMTLRSPTYRHTHVVPIFVSLLLANLLQAVATIMDLKWLLDGAVEKGHFCSVQGGIKNGGNVAMALWSFLLSLHVFMLLFLRWRSTKLLCHIILVLGWLLVALVPGIGPLAIQTAERGPYFGPSGYWCWITHNYSKEQTFLEYFFEFISAGFSFILYTAIFPRVRGNLVVIDGKWCIRFVPRCERWLLAVSRDATDSSMMHVAARMVWHPIAYTMMLLPVTIARFIAFGGAPVPFWATILADFIFNLQGLVNVLLLLSTRRLIPDTAVLPMFTRRKSIDLSSPEAYGITPFALPAPTEAEKPIPPLPNDATIVTSGLGRVDTTASVSTSSSVDSQTPMLQCLERPEFSLRT